VELITKAASQRRARRPPRVLLGIGALALGALGAGLFLGSEGDSTSQRVARDYARAWTEGDYRTMHRLLSAAARSRYSGRSFETAHRNALATATAVSLRAGRAGDVRDGRIAVPVTVRTRIFGVVRGEVLLPVDGEALEWKPNLVFPGLDDGARLRRRTEAPKRAKILSRDGKTFAEGPARARGTPLGALGLSVAGTMERAETAAERRAVFARGFPAGTPVGANGLERALQRELEGRPGGVLKGGDRVLARSEPRPAPTVRSTVDTRLQAAAVAALGGRLGGVAALDPRTGEVRALAGIAFSAPQPPGSTFKLVTTAAALEAGLVKPTDKFPVETKAVIDGVDLENAGGESCGGSFAESFAHSCNSVFAPLGVKVGARRLVDAAERFGWNGRPTLEGESPSTLPKARSIVSPLELGSTAIGQGKVLATPLQLASITQALANDGVRILPSLRRVGSPRRERVTSARVAATLKRLMVGVVGYGTGTAAAIPGVEVAGKTGTAELEDTRGPNAQGTDASDRSNTDAWFTAYAPAQSPRIVVAVLLVRNGAGGETAAPAARQVLATALGK
jgi:penicillin-binding protein A